MYGKGEEEHLYGRLLPQIIQFLGKDLYLKLRIYLTVECTRDGLHIIASKRDIVVGALAIKIRNKEIDFTRG